MAGDWIKMRKELFTHPKVVRMMSALQADKFRIVGGLMSVWSLFDSHSTDGRLDGYTLDMLDEIIGWKGFSSAMSAVGWVIQNPDSSLSLPDFECHNGNTAKRRAQDAERKKEVRKVSASEADKKRTREEKRREDIKEPPNPLFEARFEGFWKAYPRKQAKADAVKAWGKIAPDEDLAAKILHAIAMQSESEDWTKDGGRYIPLPATYLNGRRWEDEIAPEAVDRRWIEVQV